MRSHKAQPARWNRISNVLERRKAFTISPFTPLRRRRDIDGPVARGHGLPRSFRIQFISNQTTILCAIAKQLALQSNVPHSRFTRKKAAIGAWKNKNLSYCTLHRSIHPTSPNGNPDAGFIDHHSQYSPPSPMT